MKIPELENSLAYAGLYVMDFGDHCGVGFTGREVAELLESERFNNCRVYRIHGASPDGKLELTGVPGDIFRFESGLFFRSAKLADARKDFLKLIDLGTGNPPPCRAKTQIADDGQGGFLAALIYPAEYDQDISSWLLGAGHVPVGVAFGGISAVTTYYQRAEILERAQLDAADTPGSRSGNELLEMATLPVQR